MERENDFSRVHHCFKQLHVMLHDRGYVVIQRNFNISLEEFSQSYQYNQPRSQLNFNVAKVGEASNKLQVFFTEKSKLVAQQVEVDIRKLRSDGIFHAIMLTLDGISASAQQAIADLEEEFHIEHFEEAELLVNKSSQGTVPIHMVLSENQKEEFLQRFRIEVSHLPELPEIDPIARYFGLKKNQVVRIAREQDEQNTFITYRLIV